VGQKVLLRTDAFSDRRLDATVSEITPMGDPITKTYRVRLALPADTPLLPGMSVEANIINREKPGALLVPSNAVAGGVVFVIDGAVARARKVQAGMRGTRQTEILSGLEDGERVASPAFGAPKNHRVRIVEPAAEP
jgi:multidrug efflux pump subunit AcrA (membrane-fusion protein)